MSGFPAIAAHPIAPKGRQVRRLLLIGVLVSAAEVQASADQVVISYAGMPSGGKQIANWLTWCPSDGLTWFTMPAMASAALGIGSDDPYYAGTPGIDFGAPWSLMPTDYPPFVEVPVRFDSISVTFDRSEPATVPISLAGQVEQGPDKVGSPWQWEISAPGVYSRDLGGLVGNDLTLGATGFWQVTSITLDYEMLSVPEPPGLTLAMIALASLSLE